MNTPLVSICCITYNHAPFIRQSLDGMLMQEGGDYEILIHDDCSTDGTTEIVKEYAAKYPDKIFPMYEDENQYSKGVWVDGFNYRRAKGEYIAYCEGDDYWTDPLKLQKQVEFMETHPEYSVCFHNCVAYDMRTKRLVNKPVVREDMNITPRQYLMREVSGGQPLSMVFRRSRYNMDWASHYVGYCDTMEIFHLLRVGKGRVLNFVGGQYNHHDGGVSSAQKDLDRAWESCRDQMDMLTYTGDTDVLYDYMKRTFFWYYALCKKSGLWAGWQGSIRRLWTIDKRLWFRIRWTILKRRIKKTI